jgi:hypothetical protein
MSHFNNRHRRLASLVAILAVLAAAISACGGSSKDPSKRVTTTAGVPREVEARSASVHRCLLKQGVNLPERSAATAGASRLPKGVTSAELKAALEKCSAGPQLGGIGGGATSTVSANLAQRSVQFATCMRSHGIKLPPPNTSAGAPVISSKGVDTSSPAYTKAEAQCARKLALVPSG